MRIFAIMAGNVFGEIFRLITFGESHGAAVGGVIEGCPAGVAVDEAFIQAQLARRRPQQFPFSSGRREEDAIEFLSGISAGQTLGTPIAFLVWNKDAQPADYEQLRDAYRPSHADYTTEQKYGTPHISGGGRASGRETVARVIGGALAMMFLQHYGIRIRAFTLRIGPHAIQQPVSSIDPDQSLRSPLECPDEKLSEAMETYLETLRQEGDTTGGVVGCIIRGLPPGLGEPVFDKLHADLGKATLSIGACKGFEIGSGFESAAMKGSRHNDPFIVTDGKVVTSTNHSGGIQGGISNGMDIWFRAAFKPVPSIGLKQQTLDRDGHKVEIKIHGRHDVCVIPRVLPVVEAMSALVLADHMLRQRSARV